MLTLSKSTLIISSIALFLLLAGAGYVLTQKAEQPSETSVTSTATPSVTNAPVSSATSVNSPVKGSYVDYRSGILEQTNGTKILFFHAPWCPQCRALEASIQAGAIPDNTTIIKVDYDSNQALRKTYGVTLQTTLVRVNDAGTLVKKFVAYDDPRLEAVLANIL